jgi:hypothetical protein
MKQTIRKSGATAMMMTMIILANLVLLVAVAVVVVWGRVEVHRKKRRKSVGLRAL